MLWKKISVLKKLVSLNNLFLSFLTMSLIFHSAVTYENNESSQTHTHTQAHAHTHTKTELERSHCTETIKRKMGVTDF